MATQTTEVDQKQQARTLEQEAARTQGGIVAEFTDFLLHNKKWWLTPIILVLMLVGLLVVLGGTGAAPFIYTLF
ncbi:MAG: hypothetical protein JXM70_18015 [Pirellulales bacterium]|nr:hypothetical protein [Pirellulales bacterium]